MKKQRSVQTIKIKHINAEIAQLHETKAALVVLQNNGYRVDKATDPDGNPRYLLRPLNSRSKPNVKTCTNHPWRPVTDGVHCRLCVRQARMKERWEAIRPALATIRRSTRKTSAITSRRSGSPVRKCEKSRPPTRTSRSRPQLTW